MIHSRFPEASNFPGLRVLEGFGERSDDDGGVEVGVAGDAHEQAAGGEGLRGPCGLMVAGLYQQVTAWCQPSGGVGGHLPQHVEAVAPAVECQQRLVGSRLGRQVPDLDRKSTRLNSSH